MASVETAEIAGAFRCGCTSGGAAHRVRETTPAHLVDLIGRPATDGRWGNHEARIFVLDEPVAPENLPGIVSTLPLDCLRGLGEQDRFEGRRPRSTRFG